MTLHPSECGRVYFVRGFCSLRGNRQLQDLKDAAPRHRARAMVPAAIYSVTLAVAARRLQDPGCPCLTSATDSPSYPTFTLAGKTITYDSGELRVVPKPQPQIPQPLSGPRYRVMTLSLESATIRPIN